MSESRDLPLAGSELKVPHGVDASAEERRKMAADFYRQHREVIDLARVYVEHPSYRKYHPVVSVNKYLKPFTAYFESVEELPIDYRLPVVHIEIEDFEEKNAEYADKVAIDTSLRLGIPIYTDSETMGKYRKYVLDNDEFALDNLRTYYFYNEEGEFRKIQETDADFDFGKNEAYRDSGYPDEKHGFISEITPADFAMVGTSLRLAKAGFMQVIQEIDPNLATKIAAESNTKSLETQ